MNYSIIQSAREELSSYESDYEELKKRVNLSLFSLARTNLSSTEKKRVWQGLSESAKNIAEKAEEMVHKLNNVRFAEEEDVLHEEKIMIAKKYKSLLKEVQKEKETIIRQIERDTVPITPLQRKVPKEGYCYLCDIRISSEIPYRLSKKEQEVLEIEMVEGATFCSQECLLGHCREYKGREKLRQEEDKKNEEKIESGKRLVTQIQLAIGNLVDRINSLEIKEKGLKIDISDFPSEEKIGFFRRIARSLGLVRKNDPQTRLTEIQRKKGRLKAELEKKNEELQQTLVILSVNEQVQKERRGLKKHLLRDKRNIHAKKDIEDIPEE